ncbi:MAG TPA: GNAT family N-acetyltransferase [Burkholderiales bacterium]|nr:GNAT family N-acetyltransferase [Burkholderiales bacterium]
MDSSIEPVPDAAPGFSTEIARGGAEVIAALADEWRDMMTGGPCDEPFYTPEWIGAYARSFGRASEFLAVTARRAGRLVAVLPLVRERRTFAGIPVRMLRSAGNAHTCRYELVHCREHREDAVRSIWLALLRDSAWDTLLLEFAPPDGAAAQLARHAASTHCRVGEAPALPQPFVSLSTCAGDFDVLLAGLDAKFRANVRRRRRKLEARGPLALVHAVGADDRLRQFYALERAGWKGSQGTAIACDHTVQAFYEEAAAKAAARGYLSLYSLEQERRPVAMYLGLEYAGRYCLLKTAYDEALREYSPGQLITHDVLRDLVERGSRELDFLGGPMDWKSDWKPRERPLSDFHVYRGAAGRALHALRFRVRPLVSRALRRVKARS